MTDVIKTNHKIINGDSRDMAEILDSSVHLVVTSPPYWNLKRYNENENQLGHIDDYDEFLRELTKVWRECYRVLVCGGRMVCVIGDICLSRRQYGRHFVKPLHSDISVECEKIGFDNLSPIIWYKITNCSVGKSAKPVMMGNPYMPNAAIKNNIEYIIIFRKPGRYPRRAKEIREQSRIDKKIYFDLFRQVWNIPGTSSKFHPAPYPQKIPERLITMFSYVGDTVLDPFVGSGTTIKAAIKLKRNSIGIDIDKEYYMNLQKKISEQIRDTVLECIFSVDGDSTFFRL
jgi:site-specific DNA-methyltransferase (adenine-specific)